MATTPTLTLNTGATMPVVGLGTWKSAPGEVAAAVKAALHAGYRHFDCAEIYGNEAEVGETLKAAFDEGLVKREELFITSKVFNHHHQDRAADALRTTLKNLQLAYLDLYLIHWPIKFEDAVIPQPSRQPDGSPNPLIKASFEFLDTWKAMEGLLKEGLVRAIGVSNFTQEQIDQLLADSQTVPAVNQVEFHPYLVQKELLDYCTAKGIVLTAYSPLGSSDSYTGKLEGAPSLLKCGVVNGIAAEAGRSPAQVLIRWAVQKGVVVIPKSVNEERIRANFAVFDFELSADQVARLDGLNRDHRFGLGWMPGHFFPL
ncbi:aldehyde reductase [Acanthamoeba castellanii str. Neff]|jgi:diketogulonate reductase-like aldo/keto reductase|uniref:Aldehyde reductase n=1 Tax=Acanthamoeba castellanii (strain ATCC 30010 / Neff) TaxID=1257118 RepID=L8H8F7_ACACF|nr:aldehyde reductase [Acanthamoeba castellanii str. Neff]ELR20746.1 aldehyde reductase [Acanthamoeba castellanii str. Neff]